MTVAREPVDVRARWGTAKGWSLLAPNRTERTRAGQAVAVGVAGQLAGLGLLATSAWLITTASLRPPVLTLTVAIGAVQAFALSRGVARYGERLAGHDLALRILARVRAWAYGALEPLVPGPATGTRGGDLLARFVGDVDGILDLYVRAALPLAIAGLSALGAVAVAWWLDPLAGVLAAAGVVVALVLAPLLTLTVAGRAGTRLAESRGRRDAAVLDALRGAQEIVAFGAEAATLARVAAADRALRRLKQRVALATAAGAALSHALGGLLAAAMAAAGVVALRHGRISGAEVAVLAFLGLGLGETVAGLPEAAARLSGSLAGSRRVLDLATVPGAVGSRAASGALPAAAGALSAGGSVAAPLAQAAGDGPPAIALRSVTLTWAGNPRPALRELDLDLPSGRRLAVVGPSGAGKSTLAHLLLRFADPDAGVVTLDGVDVARLDPEAVRALVAWAPQDPHVFGTTLAANLRLASPGATDARLRRVVDQVGLGSWAAGLADGFDTLLGERGATVSGGEAQRIGIARALLADRPVLVLDEPTAHLDEEGAAALERQVLDAAAGRSLVWITHRLVGLDAFDEVVELVDGRRI